MKYTSYRMRLFQAYIPTIIPHQNSSTAAVSQSAKGAAAAMTLAPLAVVVVAVVAAIVVKCQGHVHPNGTACTVAAFLTSFSTHPHSSQLSFICFHAHLINGVGDFQFHVRSSSSYYCSFSCCHTRFIGAVAGILRGNFPQHCILSLSSLLLVDK